MSTQMETLVGKVVWHEHTSNDADTAKKFYTDLFGWELEIFKAGEMEYPMIKANGRTHGGFSQPEGGAPPHWLHYVLVESADETYEKVKGAGGKAIMEPFDVPDVGRLGIYSDPQGAAFATIEPNMESASGEPPAEGVFVWDELMTSDIDGAKAFYGEVFGWTSEDNQMSEDMTYTLFKRGEGIDVGGGMATPPEAAGAPPHWKPYIATDDVDATAAKAAELGATVVVEPADIPNVGRFAVLLDPQGAPFGLIKGISE